jgi:hypothetical protein
MPKGISRSTPIAAAALMLALGGCGSDSGTGVCPAGQVGTPPNCSTPTPTPPPCTQTAVLTDSGTVRSLVLIFEDFPVTESGRLDMTLDWTNPSSPMGLYLVPAGTCTLDEFNQRACNFLVRSEPSPTKPRRVSAANLPAGNYRYLVANFSSADESAALQIVLSKGTCPAISSLPPTASAQDSATALTVDRAERR